MNSDEHYAFQFYQLYNMYAGIKVRVHRDNKWEKRAAIGDIGPIAWKDIAVKIPIEEGDVNLAGEVNVRLEFFPDNLMFDYIAYETGDMPPDSLIITEIQPCEITDHLGIRREKVFASIQSYDENFLVTNPGESYYITYDIKPHVYKETSLFVSSRGYYTEWLRGNWITNKNIGYQFSLFDVDKTIVQLFKSWLENRELIENRFFETRIPL